MEEEKRRLERGQKQKDRNRDGGDREVNQRQSSGPLGFPLGQWGRRCRGGFCRFEKKRDEKILGIGGMRAAMLFRKRVIICGGACAT
jgi:hypothetical protein